MSNGVISNPTAALRQPRSWLASAAIALLALQGCGRAEVGAASDEVGPACTPATCAAQGRTCGSISDGCGHTLACGTCPAGQACGAGGVCACVPTGTCAGKDCGTTPDGCGGELTCGGSCKVGETCGGGGAANVCGAATCTPTGTCAGKNCGTTSDGCGKTLTCGTTCPTGQTCGGGGTPNVCGCTPTATCAGKCGRIANGCGGTIDCGTTCPAGQTCGGGGVANVCGAATCTPTGTCAGKNCGTVSDGCGKTLTCGTTCPAGQTCGGGGTPNVCGCTPTATCAGKCGTIANGCGGTLDCGVTCPAGQTCGAQVPNVCGTPGSVCSQTACPPSARHTPRRLSYEGAPNGFYEYLPLGYDGTTPTPLLVFWHGIGEDGNGTTMLPNVLANGPPKLIEEDAWDNARPFIVLSPQYAGSATDPIGPGLGCPSAAVVHAFLTWAVAHYSVDPKRVYLTGLSCGAIGSWDYLGQHGGSLVAAAVLVCGNPYPPSQAGSVWSRMGCSLVATSGGLAIWSLHGDQDDAVPYSPDRDTMRDLIACTSRRTAVFTPYPGWGHWIWDDVYSGGSGDVYRWLLDNPKP